MRIRSRRTIILCYHRIADCARDPHDLCVHPDRFSEQLDVLRSRAEVAPLAAASEGSTVRVVVTFDDGYADNLTAALPLLEAHAFPFTIFVIAGMVGHPRGFWWDRLAAAVLGTPAGARLEVELGGERLVIDVGSPQAREQAHLDLHERLRLVPIAEIERALEQIPAGAPDDPGRPLDERELAILAEHPLVEIGAHTVTHPLLTTLGAAAQFGEIEESRRRLEALIERPVTSFSYPFGNFDWATVRAVRRAGFRRACCLDPRTLPRGRPSLRLPRRLVYDWDGDTFARQLEAWLDA